MVAGVVIAERSKNYRAFLVLVLSPFVVAKVISPDFELKRYSGVAPGPVSFLV